MGRKDPKEMTREEIKECLSSDADFIYNGRGASFIPWCFDVGYDGEDNIYDTFDEALDAKVFDGKSIIDIWDEVYPQIS